LSGQKSFSKALVPLAPGEVSLPAVSLTYFDPGSGSYRVAASEPLSLLVRPGAGREDLQLTESVAPTSGKVAVRILADDILPLHKGLEALAPGAPRGGVAAWAGGLALPPLLWVGLSALHRRRERYARDAGLLRRRRALRRALDVVRRAEQEARAGREAEACELASRSLRELVGDKLGLPGCALTPGEVDEHLRRCGLKPALVQRTSDLLARLEAARFGDHPLSGGEVAAAVRPLLVELDGGLRAP
jgi:hypothetical protein